MESAAEEPSSWSCAAGAVAAGQTAKFRLFLRGKPVEAFIIDTDGGYHAYINHCPPRHVARPLAQ